MTRLYSPPLRSGGGGAAEGRDGGGERRVDADAPSTTLRVVPLPRCAGEEKRTRSKRGYALPAVLVVISVLTLIFVTAYAALQSLRDETRATIDQTEFQRQAMSAEARAAFLVATEPFGPDRLRVGGPRISALEMLGGPVTAISGPQVVETPVYLDDRPYRWVAPSSAGAGSRYLISLQDGAGLVNPDFSREDTLLRLFAKTHMSEVEGETLTDELLDAIDGDDERRLRGAEAKDYASAGRPPPPNAPLVRTSQLFGLLDWSKIMTSARWRLIAPLIGLDPARSAFNINTASADVLQVVLNLTPAQSQDALAQRARTPLTSLTDLGLPEGDPLHSNVFPDGHVRFTFTDPVLGAVYHSMLIVAPQSFERPIWIEDTSLSRFKVPSPGNTPANLTGAQGDDAPLFPDPTRRPSQS